MTFSDVRFSGVSFSDVRLARTRSVLWREILGDSMPTNVWLGALQSLFPEQEWKHYLFMATVFGVRRFVLKNYETELRETGLQIAKKNGFSKNPWDNFWEDDKAGIIPRDAFEGDGDTGITPLTYRQFVSLYAVVDDITVRLNPEQAIEPKSEPYAKNALVEMKKKLRDCNTLKDAMRSSIEDYYHKNNNYNIYGLDWKLRNKIWDEEEKKEIDRTHDAFLDEETQAFMRDFNPLKRSKGRKQTPRTYNDPDRNQEERQERLIKKKWKEIFENANREGQAPIIPVFEADFPRSNGGLRPEIFNEV